MMHSVYLNNLSTLKHLSLADNCQPTTNGIHNLQIYIISTHISKFNDAFFFL